jgi:uncharacterized protein (TIGR03437 family)
MKSNYIIASALALFTAFVSAAQTPVTLNTTPSRLVGHPAEGITPTTVIPNLVEGREFWQPQGIALDTSVTPNILYIADYGNNRVLAWKNAQGFRNGQQADLVIGQTDFVHTTAGGPGTAFSSNLNSPAGLAVDKNGNVYVADQVNNRILRFPRPFSQQSGQFPDMVIGQTNYTTKTGALTDTGLSLSNAAFAVLGMTFDSDGNLWVVDGGNRRVLRYAATDLANGVSGPKANLVLGASDFTSAAAAVTRTQRTVANLFAGPAGIAFDSAGRLYVSDTGSSGGSFSRVLVFEPPFSSGQSAKRLMSIFSGAATDTDGLNRTEMMAPSSMFFLPGSKMGVVDSYSNRILIFDTYEKWPDPTLFLSPQATAVFGQKDFAGRNINQAPGAWPGTYTAGASGQTLAGPLGAVFSGTELFVADTANNRVLAIPMVGGSLAPAAARVLGQDGLTYSGANLVEGREFNFLRAVSSGVTVDAGVALDETGDTPHLYVADTYNHRILGYRDFRKVKGGAPYDKADIVIGQPDFSSNLPNVTGNPDAMTASTLAFPTGVAVDAQGNLYVADQGNGRVLRFPAPFSSPAQLPAADLVLGQRTFTQKITDPGPTTMSQPYGVAVTSAGLLVSDVVHNRVLLFSFSGNGTFNASDSGKAASKVFGQPDFLTVSSGNADNKLNAPHHLSTDAQGHLYVADSGNNRIIIFDTTQSGTVDPHATLMLSSLQQPRGVFVNQLTGEVWVAEANAATVKRFSKYDNLIFTQTAVASVQAGANPLAVVQDQYGDLVLADSSSRISFYYPSMHAVNGASFLASRSFLAPGLLASLCSTGSACGANKTAVFGPDTDTILGAASPFPMPKTLADTQVLFNGEAAPLYLVSPMQINFVVPMKAPTSGTADLQVVSVSTGRVYAALTVPMSTVSPAILMRTYDGKNRQAAVVNEDGSVNDATHPAKRGSYVQIYATGQGSVTGAPGDGEAISSAITAAGTLRVNVAGTYLEDYTANPGDRPKAEWLQYSGLSPFPGLWQINAWIPTGVAPAKEVPIILVYNGVPSSDGTIVLTINVQ